MLQKILQLFSALLDDLFNIVEFNKKDLVAFTDTYSKLSIAGKESFYSELEKACNGDDGSFLLMLSALAEETGDGYPVVLIEKLLVRADMDPRDLQFYFGQLIHLTFVKNYDIDAEESFSRRKVIFNRIVDGMRSHFSSMPEKVSNRNMNRVAILISPMLSEWHAPTLRMLSVVHFLQEMGMEVQIFSTVDKAISTARATKWYHAIFSNSLAENSTGFDFTMANVPIKGDYYCLDDNNYFATMEYAVKRIADFAPAYVLSVGDNIWLSKLLQDILPVADMNTVDKAPLSAAKYVIRYFMGEQQKAYFLEPGQTQLSMPFKDCYTPHHDLSELQEELLARAMQASFRILIVGNRLDSEITPEFLEMLQEVIEWNPSIMYMIVGDSPGLQSRVKEKGIEDNFCFFGYVSDLGRITKSGSIFLNPTRSGGGGGGAYAIANGKPVITEPFGDVYTCVGSSFACSYKDGLLPLIKPYIEDEAYWKKMSELALEFYRTHYFTDSVKNITKVQNMILEAERNS